MVWFPSRPFLHRPCALWRPLWRIGRIAPGRWQGRPLDDAMWRTRAPRPCETENSRTTSIFCGIAPSFFSSDSDDDGRSRARPLRPLWPHLTSPLWTAPPVARPCAGRPLDGAPCGRLAPAPPVACAPAPWTIGAPCGLRPARRADASHRRCAPAPCALASHRRCEASPLERCERRALRPWTPRIRTSGAPPVAPRPMSVRPVAPPGTSHRPCAPCALNASPLRALRPERLAPARPAP